MEKEAVPIDLAQHDEWDGPEGKREDVGMSIKSHLSRALSCITSIAMAVGLLTLH
jgi:hypothetical protein